MQNPFPYIVRIQKGGKASGTGAKGEKVMQAILEQNNIAERLIDRTAGAFGEKIGLVAKLFGCKHKALTRPFTNNDKSYRACLECGARTEFDTQSFRTLGTFYYPPSVTSRP